MAKLVVVYWRDIPAQVIAKRGRDSVKVSLSRRFAEAIDRAAMRAGKGSSDAYLNEWRRLASACDDDLRAAAAAEAERLEAAWSGVALERTAKARGLRPESA